MKTMVVLPHSCAGKMRSGQKSELVQLLEASTMVECPDVDVKVFDADAHRAWGNCD